jgi:hypothetical protein
MCCYFVYYNRVVSSGVHQEVRGSLRVLYSNAPRIASCALLTSSSASVLIGRLGSGGVNIALVFSQFVEPSFGRGGGSSQSTVIKMVTWSLEMLR